MKERLVLTGRDADALERLRKICSALPGVEEVLAWGHPNWKVAGKIFAAIGKYQDRLSIGFKATLPEQGVLVQEERFFVSPYVGKHGWTSLVAEGRIDWKELEGLVRRSWRLIAPKKLVAAMDDGGAPLVPAGKAGGGAKKSAARGVKKSRTRPAAPRTAKRQRSS